MQIFATGAARVALLLVVASALAACSTGDLRYRHVVDGALPFEIDHDDSIDLPIRAVHPTTHEPVAGARVELATRSGPLELKANRAGEILFPLRSGLYSENPVITIATPDTTLWLSYSVSFRGKSVDDLRVLNPVTMPSLSDSRLAVFYPPDAGALAPEVWRELRNQRRQLERFLGFAPRTWAVMLATGDERPNVLYLTVPARGYALTWTCFTERWHDRSFARINVHEWAESSLGSELHDLYDDPRNRFIGDGLAELASWSLYGLEPDYGYAISEKMLSEPTVDLTESFRVVSPSMASEKKLMRSIEKQGFAAGYPLSFVFWYELTREHGDDLPARFLTALKKREGALRFEDCLATLQSLTGESGLQDRIRRIDVGKAREVIAGLARRQK